MTSQPAKSIGSYDLFMFVLCGFAIGALLAENIGNLSAETRGVLRQADYALCALFLADFLIQLDQAKDRKKYMMTWGWLDLLSSIPIPGAQSLRIGRTARLVRIVRLIRGVRSIKIAMRIVAQHRAQSTVLAAALFCLFLVIFGSILILQVEPDAGGSIRQANDAIWWSVATLANSGHSDLYPVSSEGKTIASVLMIAGGGLIGVVAGFLASWFGSPEDKKQDAILAGLREEVRDLRLLIERQSPPKAQG